jgi:hypothetical protein
MRKFHTLTFNETTYTINDGNRINDIFINGQETDWYVEYGLERFNDVVIPRSIKLKNRNDGDNLLHYNASPTNGFTLSFNDIVEMIKIIEEESFRNN